MPRPLARCSGYKLEFHFKFFMKFKTIIPFGRSLNNPIKSWYPAESVIFMPITQEGNWIWNPEQNMGVNCLGAFA